MKITDMDITGEVGQQLFIKFIVCLGIERGQSIQAVPHTNPFDGLVDVWVSQGDMVAPVQVKTKGSGITVRRKNIECVRSGSMIQGPRPEYGMESWRWDRYVRKGVEVVIVDISGHLNRDPLFWLALADCAPRYGCRADCANHTGFSHSCDQFVFVDARCLVPMNDAARTVKSGL